MQIQQNTMYSCIPVSEHTVGSKTLRQDWKYLILPRKLGNKEKVWLIAAFEAGKETPELNWFRPRRGSVPLQSSETCCTLWFCISVEKDSQKELLEDQGRPKSPVLQEVTVPSARRSVTSQEAEHAGITWVSSGCKNTEWKPCILHSEQFHSILTGGLGLLDPLFAG